MCVSCDLTTESPWLTAWLSWAWGALPFLRMFSIQTEQFVSTRVAAKGKWTACTHLIPDIWFWLAWLPSSSLFPLGFIQVLTISRSPWRFLHADCRQQGSLGTEPDPLPVLSPAGRALPSTVSSLAPQHPTEHLLSTAPGSAGTQRLPQPFLGLSMWDVLREHGRVLVHTVCSCAWCWLN